MGDWIDDVFDELYGRVVDVATRYRLEDLLETAMIEDGEDRADAVEHELAMMKVYCYEVAERMHSAG